jgi:hypothetical protein
MSGSKPARPTITIQGSNFSGTHRGIEYKNTDTGEKLVFNKASGFFGNTDIVKIDCELRKVLYSNDSGSTFTEQRFYGVFPRFKIGTNNVQITVGDIVNQSSIEATLSQLNISVPFETTTKRAAQSFTVPYTDSSFASVTLAIAKLGAPGNLTVEICVDDDGKPGSGISGASGTIAHAAVGTSLSYVTISLADAVTLQANTKYWIVLSAAASLDGSNSYSWYGGSTSIYPRGKARTSTNSGASYSDITGTSLSFRVHYGGISNTGSVTHTVTYTPTYL